MIKWIYSFIKHFCAFFLGFYALRYLSSFFLGAICCCFLFCGCLSQSSFEKEYSIRVKNDAQFVNNVFTRTNQIIVNGTEEKCSCGKDPVVVLILYGELHVYCFNCIVKLASQLANYQSKES